jgi:adenine-specific DNA-methyltransferase
MIEQLNADGYLEFRNGTPFKRYFEDEEGAEHDPFYCFMDVDLSSTSEAGKNQLNQILGNNHGFDTVKPTQLLKTLIRSSVSARSNDVILDFFAGSSTSAHSVMDLNAEDGGTRRFIMVQLPEPCDEKKDAYNTGYKTIAEISKERIRRAGKKIKEENATTAADLDIGFRVLKIDTSNAKDIYYTPDAINQEELALQVDHIKEGRTAEDLLFQVMLDWGVDLALPIASESIQGKTVFFVDENAIAACFDANINEAFVKELAKREPLRVVFRDTCFESDSAKINVAEIFKLLSPNKDIKTL